MRNGNDEFLPIFLKVIESSYRTYEEWKLCPSRASLLSFVSSYRTYEEWKLAFCHAGASRTQSFLPYLWGMETPTIPCRTSSMPRSYRTYEEWKLINTATGRILRQGSYRTYEEWKRPEIHIALTDELGFLPYLWGMETKPSHLSVCSLYQFLPYLWGMETWLHQRYYSQEAMFLPYLWGMETCDSIIVQDFKVCVLTVPMRNGNLFIYGYISVLYFGSYRTYEEWKLI